MTSYKIDDHLIIIRKNPDDWVKVKVIKDNLYYEQRYHSKYLEDLMKIPCVESDNNRAILRCETGVDFVIPRITQDRLEIMIVKQNETINRLSSQMHDLTEKMARLDKFEYVYRNFDGDTTTYKFTREVTICSFKMTGVWQDLIPYVHVRKEVASIYTDRDSCKMIEPVSKDDQLETIVKIEYSTDDKKYEIVNVANNTVPKIHAKYIRMWSSTKLLNCFAEVTFYSYPIDN